MPSSPDTVTQISKTELPKWVEGASESNYNLAKALADRKYVPYTGSTVAALPTRADDYFKGTMGAGNADLARARGFTNNASVDFNRARDALGKATGDFGSADRALAESQTYARAGSRGINSLNRASYMNPFVSNVENRALDALNRETTMGLNDNASKAVAAKAFGGSRSAIIDAVTRGESSRAAGDLSAKLRRDAYDEATRSMEGDLARKFQTAASLQGAASGYIGAGQGRIGQAGGYNTTGMGRLGQADRSSATAEQVMKNRMQNYAGLMQGDQRTQAYNQSKLDDAYRRFKEKRDYPIEGLNLRLSALGMSPYGKTESVKKTEQSGTDFASIGGGILSMLPALFMLSDETTKTAKKPITIDNDTGIPIYEYRYRGEPKHVKRVGPMAQDVQKVFPERVQRIGGKLAIRMA